MNADLTSRVQRLALRQQATTQEHARRNRERFPAFASFLDDLARLAGGPCRVRYLHDADSGYTAGSLQPRGVPTAVLPTPIKR